MVRKRNAESGFTHIEMVAVMLIIVILVAVVLLQVLGVFGGARGAAMDTDIHTVQTAVDAYYLESMGRAPTEDGNLPLGGGYALIDFDASFTHGGTTRTFYPQFVKKLPKHYDEGVWCIDSGGGVSVDMEPEDY